MKNDFPFIDKLDPYEQELEDEFERLEKAGLLVKGTLTPERRKELEQTAANTIEMLRLGRRDLIEYSEEPTSTATHSIIRSVTAPLNQRKPTDRKPVLPSLRTPMAAVA